MSPTQTEFIYLLTMLVSGVAAILAWFVKLKWAEEYRKAKEAEIDSLKQEIATLRLLSPAVLVDSYQGLKTQLEDYISRLNQQLEAANQDIQVKDLEIEQLVSSGAEQAEAIARLTTERNDLVARTQRLEEERSNFEIKVYRPLTFRLPVIDPVVLGPVAEASRALENLTHHPGFEALRKFEAEMADRAKIWGDLSTAFLTQSEALRALNTPLATLANRFGGLTLGQMPEVLEQVEWFTGSFTPTDDETRSDDGVDVGQILEEKFPQADLEIRDAAVQWLVQESKLWVQRKQ